MKEEKDKIRDLMHKVFDDYEVAPDPEDWNRIEKTLSKRKGRGVMIWTIRTIAASLLLLLAIYTGGILKHSGSDVDRTATYSTHPNKNNAPSTEKSALPAKDERNAHSVRKQLATNQPSERKTLNKAEAVPSTNVTHNNTLSVTSGIHKVTQPQPGQFKNIKSSEKGIQKANTPETKSTLLAKEQLKQTLPHASTGKPNDIIAALPTEATSGTRNADSRIHPIIPKSIGTINNISAPERDKSKDFKPDELIIQGYLSGNKNDELANNNVATFRIKGLSLNNSSGMVMKSSSNEMMSFDGLFASQLASNMYLNSVKTFNNSYLSSLDIGNLFRNNSRIYLPPVTFGLNINLSLQDQASRQGHWSIETGIQYTRLQSSGSVSINSSNAVQFTTRFGYTVDESLHYLGIPIIINYNFDNHHKTSFYLSSGISIEKGVIAKYKATPKDNFPGMDPITSHNAIRGLQISLSGGFGINYKVIKHVELFGQPSLTYYLNSQGYNTTIFSIHPLLFNLRSGIRFTIK